MDAAGAVAAGIEAPPQLGRRMRAASPAKAAASATSRREVGLTDELSVAELVRQLLEPAGVEGGGAHHVRSLAVATLPEPAHETPCRIAIE